MAKPKASPFGGAKKRIVKPAVGSKGGKLSRADLESARRSERPGK